MPTSNTIVAFKYGPQMSYDSESPKDNNTVYWCYDTGRIFIGSIEFAPQVDWNTVYPINSIIMFYDDLDHSDHLGFTWARCLLGRVPVGQDINDTDFSVIGMTLGEKTHQLTAAESVELLTDSHTEGLIGGSSPAITGYGSNSSPHNNIQPSEVINFWRRIN